MVASDIRLESFQSVGSAQTEFRHLLAKAFLETLLNRLRGKPLGLLPLATACKEAGGCVTGRRRLEEIPLARVIGSTERSSDYTPSFLPRNSSDEARWVRIKRVVNGTGGLPPISVFKLGDAYFVEDGHHRVSVLKQLGVRFTEAWVTEVHPVVEARAA